MWISPCSACRTHFMIPGGGAWGPARAKRGGRVHLERAERAGYGAEPHRAGPARAKRGVRVHFERAERGGVWGRAPSCSEHRFGGPARARTERRVVGEAGE